MKNLIFTLIVLVAVISQSCNNSEGKSDALTAKTSQIPVRVMELKQTGSAPLVETSGFFTTDDETILAFKTGGVVDKIYVKEGSSVRKGQLLATLNLTEINTQVAQAKLGHEKAARDFQRVENLFKDSVATMEQYQNARTALEVAQRQLEAARFNLSYSEIRAVQNGFVLNKLAGEGQVVGPGTPVLRVNGAGNGQWKLKVGVSDRQWAFVKMGDKAKVTTDAYPDKTFEAQVTAKAEGTDGLTGTFIIELTLTHNQKGLASGLFGKAVILSGTQQHAWQIPYDALLDGNGQTGYVFTTNDSKRAVKTPVTLAGMERDVILVNSGLEHAEKLIVSGGAYLKDGSPIRIIQ